MSGEGSDDRLSRIEERLERMERLLESASGVEGREPGSRGNSEPLDVEKAHERLEKLDQRIEETRRQTLGRESTTEPVAETKDPTPEGDAEQAEEAVGGGPPAPG